MCSSTLGEVVFSSVSSWLTISFSSWLLSRLSSRKILFSVVSSSGVSSFWVSLLSLSSSLDFWLCFSGSIWLFNIFSSSVSFSISWANSCLFSSKFKSLSIPSSILISKSSSPQGFSIAFELFDSLVSNFSSFCSILCCWVSIDGWKDSALFSFIILSLLEWSMFMSSISISSNGIWSGPSTPHPSLISKSKSSSLGISEVIANAELFWFRSFASVLFCLTSSMFWLAFKLDAKELKKEFIELKEIAWFSGDFDIFFRIWWRCYFFIINFFYVCFKFIWLREFVFKSLIYRNFLIISTKWPKVISII